MRRTPDFTTLWVAQTASELGSSTSSFAFPLLTVALTGSPLLAGVVGAAHLLGEVAGLLPGGVLADRLDRRLVMRSSSALGAVAFASLGVAGAVGGVTVAHLVVVALLAGVAAGLFTPSEMSAVRTVVDRDDLPTALSLNQARMHVAGLVGAPLGALLYGVARWLPFVTDAVSYAGSWLLLGRLRTDLRATTAPGPGRTLADLREGAAYLWRDPLQRTVTAWACLTNLSMNALFTVAVLRMVSDGVDPFHIGLVDVGAGAAGILGAVLAPWLVARVPTGRLTIAVGWSAVPVVVPMALWGDPLVVAAGLAVVMLVNPASNAGMGAYRMTVTPDALVGRVQAASRVVSMSSLPLAPLLAGGLLTGVGGTAAVLGCGVVCAVVALVPTLSRHVWAVPRPSEWGGPPATGDMMTGCRKETASTSSPASSTAA